MTLRLATAVLSLALAVATSPAARGDDAPPACGDVPGFHELDFWLGEWVVTVGDQLAGTNRITPILDGCAVREQWSGAGGGRGESLFYFLPATGEWKQVWVTARATAPGGVKEKHLIERLDGGALRFQGTIAKPDGSSYFDRTTLTPLEGDRVRQVIEVSRDGVEWTTGFDAIYARPESLPPASERQPTK